MKAGLVLFRVHQLNLSRGWCLLRLLRWRRDVFSDCFESFPNPKFCLLQSTARHDSCAALGNLHRRSGGRTVTARLEHVLLSHLFLLSAPRAFSASSSTNRTSSCCA